MTWKQALALAAALGVTIVPAAANTDLPPAKYDIGGATEAQVLANYDAEFGTDVVPLIRAPYGRAKALCDSINMARYGVPYPAGDENNTLVGCMIRDEDGSDAMIVYSVDPDRPSFAGQIIRHEIGHLLGWPGDHRRD